MTVAVADGRVNPTVSRITTIEDVIKVQTENGFLQHLLGLQGIAQAGVRDAVGRLGTVGILSIIKILATDEVRVPDSLPTLIV